MYIRKTRCFAHEPLCKQPCIHVVMKVDISGASTKGAVGFEEENCYRDCCVTTGKSSSHLS